MKFETIDDILAYYGRGGEEEKEDEQKDSIKDACEDRERTR